MVYCGECGYKLHNGAAFCNLCGSDKLENFTYTPNRRNLRYIEEHFHCGICKGIITGKEKFCPYCGKQYTSKMIISPPDEYIKELNTIEDKRTKKQESNSEALTPDPLDIEKLVLIRSFPIPVPYKYIKEFIIYATESVDEKLSKIPTDDEVFDKISKGNTNLEIKKAISDEWLIKLQAAYKKAEEIFTENPEELYKADEDFGDLQKIYFDKLKKLNLAKSYETKEE